MTRPRRPVLLYDDGCRLCRFAARTVARADRARSLAFLPLDAPEADALLSGLGEEERWGSWHLVLSDGRRAARGYGAPLLARTLGLRRTARALRLLPLERLYDLVAGHRSTLGRLLPDGPGPKRYP